MQFASARRMVLLFAFERPRDESVCFSDEPNCRTDTLPFAFADDEVMLRDSVGACTSATEERARY